MQLDLDDRIPPRFEDAGDRLTYLLSEYKLGVYAAAVAGILLILTGRAGIPSPPGWINLALQGVALGILPSMLLGKLLIVDKFIPDPRLKIEVWTPDDQDGAGIVDVEHWRIPADVWEDREHTHGMPALEPGGTTDYIVTNLEYMEDIGRLAVRGCNPELADPVAIQATKGKLDETFNELLSKSSELSELQATLKLQQQQTEEKTVNAVVAAVEDGLAFEDAQANVSNPFEDYDEQTAGQPGQQQLEDPDRPGEDSTNGHRQDPDAILDQIL